MLVCVAGDMSVNGNQMEARDAAELTAPTRPLPLALKMGQQGGHFMLIEMKHVMEHGIPVLQENI